ncbi:hypothetical protein AV530_013928 [Patagioenas fasciata monilis]|uniref:Uncharacterized protein n=1 Tax=Patagioenas fasciata monilis TaxID=372326 RepID=A0A1V4KN14_PATFA|nr:hypothetical protein AV530_013928 [Patagioenas fasciata monilis]
MEVEKLTTHDTEPRLQLKQKNQSPQIHNRLVGSVSSLSSVGHKCLVLGEKNCVYHKEENLPSPLQCLC